MIKTFIRTRIIGAFTEASLSSLYIVSFCVFLSAGIQVSPVQGKGKPAAMFRGGAAHEGVYQVSGAPRFGGIKWKLQTGGPIRSAPTVAGNRIYVGSGDGCLYALDTDGSVIWKRATGSAVASSPAVWQGTVFAQNRAGEVLALDAATGAPRWDYKTGKDLPFDWGYESGDIYISSPVIVDGILLIGSGDGNLYALNARNGRLRWKYRTGGRVRSSPAVKDGAVYVGSMDGSLYALNLKNGKQIWRFDTLGRSLRSGDFGFDRKSIQSSPAVAGETVYFGARDGFLYAVDIKDGKQRWSVDHKISWINTSPAVEGELVYAGSSDAQFMQAVEASTGKEVWRVKTDSIVWSSPAIASGIAYFGDGAGRLHAVDARTGKVMWQYMMSGGIHGAPVPVEDGVLVGSNDGVLYAVNGGADRLTRRIVYWDAAYEKSAWVSNHSAVKDFLASNGYEVMDTARLASFLDASVRDETAGSSVITFAIDNLPQEIVGSSPDSGPFRRFLNAGGKVVWIGVPPLILPRDAKTGETAGIKGISRGRVKELLGVDFSSANFDKLGASASADGQRWGLAGWWLAPWSINRDGATEVLAVDEHGLASSWVKRYAEVPGSGFVMIGRGPGTWTDMQLLLAVADYRPQGKKPRQAVTKHRTQRKRSTV